MKASAPGATGAVAVWDVLMYAVEVAEFGARMASVLDVSSLTFEFAVAGVAGRELISGGWNRELRGPYLNAADVLETTAVVDAARLLAHTRQVGVEIAQEILRQFGLNVPDQVLYDWQAKDLR